MSSQFSYELDERQIRLAMQDAELDYNEALWHKFDEMSLTQAKSSTNIGNYIPTINLGISRSIIVPVIFIVLIGGLSAMLFSFVDFKKKEAIEKEVPYVAKTEPIKQPEASYKPVIKTKAVVTPSVAIDNSVIDTSLSATVTNTTNTLTEPAIKKEESAKIVEQKEIVSEPIVQKKETLTTPHKKKRKMKTEVLPIINTATVPNLNEGARERELDLK